ncbi:MAG: FkbM family methyltransferase [Alphaproteobacteria bacterium]|nr:MAG: FkbM family methyltransferase [Alphaproteobacteria bacterium]
MRKYCNSLICIAAVLFSASFGYWGRSYIPWEVKDAILRSPFYEFYTTHFRDIKNIDDDHVLSYLDNGMKIVVNKHDRCVCYAIRALGYWDKTETNVIKALVKQGDTVVEVGANFGVHTLRFSELVGSSGKVYSFEANPRVAKYLRQSLDINNIQNVDLRNAGIGDRDYDAQMIYESSNIGAGYILSSEEAFKTCKVKECQPVRMTTLDKELVDLTVDFLKIDIEGYEPYLFKGAQKIIASNKNLTILMEWDLGHMKRGGGDVNVLVSYLKNQDFKAWILVRGIGMKKINLEDLRHVPACDVVLSRKDLRDFSL